jgi:integrase
MARSAKSATIRRRLSSISVAHHAAGHNSPAADLSVRSAWAGIRWVNGVARIGKTALLTEDIRRMVTILPDTTLGRRDACPLLLGFAWVMRRSEPVALDVSDVDDTVDGLVVTIRRSKTNQEGVGRQVGIPDGSDPRYLPRQDVQGVAGGVRYRRRTSVPLG